MDEALRSKVIKILEDEQNELKKSLEPQTTVVPPKTITTVEASKNPDGTLIEKTTETPSNYVDESVTTQYKEKIAGEAETLQQFCKIIDDKIITINSQINQKKQQIVSLTTEARDGNCWPGVAYSSFSASPNPNYNVALYYGDNVNIREEIENIRIYPNIAGPSKNVNVENPFEPDAVYKLTSSYSGYGYKNLPDKKFYKNKDGTLTGLGTDGSGDSYGTGKFDISQNLVDHNTRMLSITIPYRWYAGSSIPPSRCVQISQDIDTLYNEIIDLRKQRDSLRSDLNVLKEDKSDRELSSWGVRSIDHEVVKRSTKNLGAISATKAFDSNDLVGVENLVLSLDVADPDSYSGIGTTWYDKSGNANYATLFPTNSPATYEYNDGHYLTFNAVNQYAQTVTKSTNVLGAGTNWSIEVWFKVNGAPSNLGFTVEANAEGTLDTQTTTITKITTTGISAGQYVKEKYPKQNSPIIDTDTKVTQTGTLTVSIDKESLNVGIATTSLNFGRYITYTNAIVDVNASSTTTNMLSVSYAQNGIFQSIPTNRLVYTASETGNNTTHLVGTAVTAGYWYHGVVVRNGTTNTKLYMNGVVVSTYSGDFPLGTASAKFTKLAAWTDETSYANVSMPIVKIYQKSLTDDEVQKKFSSVKNRFDLLG